MKRKSLKFELSLFCILIFELLIKSLIPLEILGKRFATGTEIGGVNDHLQESLFVFDWAEMGLRCIWRVILAIIEHVSDILVGLLLVELEFTYHFEMVFVVGGEDERDDEFFVLRGEWDVVGSEGMEQVGRVQILQG
jgi:hypothetical protein